MHQPMSVGGHPQPQSASLLSLFPFALSFPYLPLKGNRFFNGSRKEQEEPTSEEMVNSSNLPKHGEEESKKNK
jgi:hypothetical protein